MQKTTVQILNDFRRLRFKDGICVQLGANSSENIELILTRRGESVTESASRGVARELIAVLVELQSIDVLIALTVVSGEFAFVASRWRALCVRRALLLSELRKLNPRFFEHATRDMRRD